jgi:hypothetical protein
MAARTALKAAKVVADPARTHAPEHQRPVDAPPNLQIPANGRSAVTGIARPDRGPMAGGTAVIHARKAAASRVRIKRAAKVNAGPAPARKGVAHKVRTTGIGAADHPRARLHAAMDLPSLHARRTTIVATDRALLAVHAMAARKPGSSIATHTSSHRMVRGLHSVNRNAARPRRIHETAGRNPGSRIVLSLSSNRKARRMTLATPSANINAVTSARGLHRVADLKCGSTIISRLTFTMAARTVTLATPSANINAVTSAHGLHRAADLRCGSIINSRLTSTTVARMAELASPNAANSARERASADLRCGSRVIIITTSIRRVPAENPALCNTIPSAVMAGQGRGRRGRIQRRAPIVTHRTSGPWDLAWTPTADGLRRELGKIVATRADRLPRNGIVSSGRRREIGAASNLNPLAMEASSTATNSDPGRADLAAMNGARGPKSLSPGVGPDLPSSARQGTNKEHPARQCHLALQAPMGNASNAVPNKRRHPKARRVMANRHPPRCRRGH